MPNASVYRLNKCGGVGLAGGRWGRAGGGRALPAGTMRRAMRALEAAGGSISYRVLIAVEPV